MKKGVDDLGLKRVKEGNYNFESVGINNFNIELLNNLIKLDDLNL